jgi:hypothetical protein
VHRQGSATPYTLIEGPCAWYGRDYTSEEQQQQFVIHLTPAHIQELDAALEQVLASGLVQQQGDYLRFVSAWAARHQCVHHFQVLLQFWSTSGGTDHV